MCYNDSKMSERFIKVFKKYDVKEVQKHLLVFGDLSANCGNCQAVNLKLEADKCPECNAEFQYIAFRNIKNHLPKLQKINDQKPQMVFIDYDDFKKNLSAVKARDFLK